MNNQTEVTEISHEIYHKHHIHIHKRSGNGRLDSFSVYHKTPQSYALQQKYPSWHKGYRDFYANAHNLEQAEAYVASIKAKIDEKVKAKEARLAEKAKAREEFVNPYKAGDILYSSWGYEQTNREFYQVVAVGNRSLKLREIGYNVVRSTSWCSEDIAPAKDKFVSDEIHRVNIVVVVWSGKAGHTIKSPIYGGLYKYEGGTLNHSWGH